jgi:ribosome-binding protein aMBF1 (putative translation factor)
MLHPMTISNCIDRIRAYASLMGWTKSRLAKEAGLSDTVLRHFDESAWNPTRATIERIELVIPADFTNEAAQ